MKFNQFQKELNVLNVKPLLLPNLSDKSYQPSSKRKHVRRLTIEVNKIKYACMLLIA